MRWRNRRKAEAAAPARHVMQLYHGKGRLLSHDYEVMKYCVEDYLRFVRSLDATMEALEEDIAKQTARLNLMGVSLDGGGGGCPHDALPEGIVKLMELRAKWSDEYAHCADDLEYARELCKPSNVNRRIVWLHRVCRMTWEVVGREVGYSAQHARRLSERGIVELYYMMPEEWRRDPIPNART